MTPSRPLIPLLALLLLAACAGEEQEQRLRLSGTVEAREVDLSFRVGGRIAARYKEEGELVAAGEVLARLDGRDYQLGLQRASAEAEAAKAQLAALTAGSRPQELRTGEAVLKRAEEQLRFARAEAQRQRELGERELVSDEQVERAVLEQRLAEAQVQEARQRLGLLREGPRTEEIARAEAELQARLAALDLAQRQLGYTALEAAAPGIVAARLAEVGEVVQPGQPVLRIAQMSEPWVRAFLPEPWLGRVRLGQPAVVRVDGVEQAFEGRLSFIAPQAEFTPRTVETRELRTDLVYRIKVEVADPAGRLKRGMPADVYLDPVPAQGE